MGLYVRKRVRVGRRSWVNVSKRGVSFSERVGPLTLNSRGRTSLRLGRGIGYRGGCVVLLLVPVGLSVLTVLTAVRVAR